MIAPCKNCPSRFSGCHSVCLQYMNYRTERDEFNENRRKNNIYSQYRSELFDTVKHNQNRGERR